MRSLVGLMVASVLLGSCKSKNIDLSSDSLVTPIQFVTSFPKIDLPYLIQDTMMVWKKRDTLPVASKLVSRFIPDTVFSKEFPKGVHPRFHALGRVKSNSGETYLFLKASAPGRQTVYLLCFNENSVFRAGMALLPASPVSHGFYEGGMDRRYSIIQNHFNRNEDEQLTYHKNVFVYNNAGVFTLILKESNEAVLEKELYNPIDTLPRRNILSADYVLDKNNIISIRDARHAGRLAFFIHFEQKEGECKGELRGEADLIKPDLAIYHEVGDHCQLEFTFSGRSVGLRELQGCGNHRGVKCFFEGNYPRKKVSAKAKSPLRQVK
jgi:hypothetical protein